MKVALESSTLCVARLDDAGARGAEILELRPQLRLRDARSRAPGERRRDLVDKLRIVEQAWTVSEQRDLILAAHERGQPHLRAYTRAPTAVDEPAVIERIRQLQ